MRDENLITPAQNTWCPGCGNFSIQHMLKSVIAETIEEGVPAENIVLVTGIGCHGKIADYLNVNSFYAIHGRAIPVATGIKLANPDLRVIACVGDGDSYGEGLDHLIFAAKRNIGITVLVHDNRVYGLTTGQFTPTSPVGFKGRSTPAGNVERPLNPPELMLASGATFIARGYTRKLKSLKAVIKEGIMHPGFSFVEILQICATYYNLTDYYNRFVYELQEGDYDPEDYLGAFARVREWDYGSDGPIPLGVLYRTVVPAFEESSPGKKAGRQDREEAIKRFLEERV